MIEYSPYVNKSISITGIGYHFSSLHICTIRRNKQLAFDESTNVLKLSLDNGLTYAYTLDLSGILDQIQRSKIYANGNIMWASNTKCYYSTDNLVTYHESTVLGIDGLTFIPSTYDNFKQLIYDDEVIVNGVQMDIWGNYSIETGTQYENINAWYTIDSGITIKSCFKYGVTLNGQMFRHVHSINYCYVDGTFWMRTGDGMDKATGATQFANCFWNVGTYNWGNDTWSWATKGGGGVNYEPDGVVVLFHNNKSYWGCEVTTGAQGVWEAPYSDLVAGSISASTVNVANKVQLFSDVTYGIVGLFLRGKVMIATDYNVQNLHISTDYGVTWTKYTLTGGPTLMTGVGAYHCGEGPDENGYFRFEIVAASDVNYRDFTKGTVLMLRVK